jgi:hypothetical protein
MIIRFCENLLSRIRERQAIYVKSISSGDFPNFEEYKFCAGKLKGIEEAEAVIKELYNSMFESKVLREEREDSEDSAVKLY